jgi:Mg2+-importing ATPase
MDLPTTTSMHPLTKGAFKEGNSSQISDQLLDKARADQDTVLKVLASRLCGLTQEEADSRLKEVGPNEIAREKHQSALMRLLSNVKNPLVLLLTALGVLSYMTGDLRATAVIFVMVILGVVLRFVQEMRADNSRDAANDRDGQSIKGCSSDGAQESHRQTTERYPKFRSDGRAVHRQDRHADARQDRP